jgi:replicative DNA helicase
VAVSDEVQAYSPPSDFERTPPQDLAAEQSVLGGMLLSKDAIADVVEIVRSNDFYKPAHALVFDTILDLYGRGEPADPVTVVAALADRAELVRVGGAPYVHTLIQQVPTAANAAYYARIVAERAVLRRLVEAGTRIVQLGYGSAAGAGREVDDVVDMAQQAIYDVTERRTSDDYTVLEELLQPTMDEIEAIGATGGVMSGVPTGFADLDRLTNGLHPGQLIIVAARPGLGKSTFGLDVARSASIRNRLTSCVFSLEMSKIEITMRLLSAEARVPLHHLRSGQLSEDDWTKLARRIGEVSEAPLFIDDSPNMTMMEIRAKARRLKQRHGLRLVVVDYLQLMTGNKRVESRQQEVAELSRGLKLLAKELEVPVIAASQLNRGPEQRTDKRPQLSDLRESGCLTADTTLLRADTGAPITFEKLLADGTDGISVWSLDENLQMVAAPLVKVFASGVKETFRLTLASGLEVKASANHPFLTFAGWAPVSDLQVGTRLAVPRRIPAPLHAGLGWSEHRLGLLAHLIGDGCVLPRQPLHYTSEDEANLSFVERAAAEEFGITPRRVAQKTWFHTYLPSPYPLTHRRRNPVHEWFHDLGIAGLRSYEKRLPDALYAADDAEIATFLRHLWATDGCVFVPKPEAKKSVARIYYATSSRALADGVVHLLGRLGIRTRLATVKHKLSERPGYQIGVAGVTAMRRFCAEIGVHGARGAHVAAYLQRSEGIIANTNADTLPKEVWETVRAERLKAGLTERQFQAAIGTNYCGSALYKACPSRERLARCAKVLDSPALRSLATDDVFWDRVVKIEPLGAVPVYDATVKETHNFVANGIIAHNSIEQDADMVILLHREDYYEKESPRAGEADFILAKHRNGPTDTVTVAFQGHFSRFVDMSTGM